MESPDQNKNMSGSSLSLLLTPAPLITLHQAAVWQISTCIDQYVGNNSRVYVSALQQDNSAFLLSALSTRKNAL